MRLDDSQDPAGPNVNTVTPPRTIQRKPRPQDHALEVGEADPFGIPPETFQLVREFRHAESVTEYGYTINGILPTTAHHVDQPSTVGNSTRWYLVPCAIQPIDLAARPFDDPSKRGLQIHGVPILGAIAEVKELVEEKGVDEVVVAIPSADRRTMRRYDQRPIRISRQVRSLIPAICLS
jgi:hypothetical protein